MGLLSQRLDRNLTSGTDAQVFPLDMKAHGWGFMARGAKKLGRPGDFPDALVGPCPSGGGVAGGIPLPRGKARHWGSNALDRAA